MASDKYIPGGVSSFLSKSSVNKSTNPALAALFGSPVVQDKKSIKKTQITKPPHKGSQVVSPKKKKQKGKNKNLTADTVEVTERGKQTENKAQDNVKISNVENKKTKQKKKNKTNNKNSSVGLKNVHSSEVDNSAIQEAVVNKIETLPKKKKKQKKKKKVEKKVEAVEESPVNVEMTEIKEKTVTKKRKHESDQPKSPKKKRKAQEESTEKKDVDNNKLADDTDEENVNKNKADDKRDNRTVFVGNLPTNFQKRQVWKKFKQFGRIETVRIRSAVPSDLKIPVKAAVIRNDLHPGKACVNAYVVYTSEEFAKKATTLNGTQIEEHFIRVDIVGKEQKHDQSRSVFVGNLPFDAQEDELRLHFKDCGTITNVRIIRDKKTGLGKGFGYVGFEKTESVLLALNLKGDKFRKRSLRVMRSANIKAAEPDDAQKEAKRRKEKKERLKNLKKKEEAPQKIKPVPGSSGGKHVKFEEDEKEVTASSFQGMRAQKEKKEKRDKKKFKRKKGGKKNSMFKKTGSGGQKNKFSKKTFAMNRLAKKMKKKS